MEEQEQVVEDQEDQPEVTDQMVVSLMRESHILKNWVAGLVSGCEGCIADATRYTELMGWQHEG